MSGSVWERLEKEFHEYPTDFGGPRDSEKVKEAEKNLGVVFADSYKKFLIKYGSATLGGHNIYGLVYLSGMGESTPDIVSNTKFYKEFQKWPGIKDWYVISDDGSGNPIGVDPAGVVWLSDHDSGFEKLKLADNFEEFLVKLLDDTLYED